jgi:hypothetical protein
LQTFVFDAEVRTESIGIPTNLQLSTVSLTRTGFPVIFAEPIEGVTRLRSRPEFPSIEHKVKIFEIFGLMTCNERTEVRSST